MRRKIFNLFIAFMVVAAPVSCQDILPVWGFECRTNKCTKTPLSGEHKGQSLTLCKMICGDEIGTLWPKPTGTVQMSRSVVQIDYQKIRIQHPSSPNTETPWRLVKNRFKAQINTKFPDSELVLYGGVPLIIRISIEQSAAERKAIPSLTYETDESYTLRTSQSKKHVFADIIAKSFFGARHGLETLLQVIVYDDILGSMQILVDTEINDAPVYKHRGVLLDTGRNYFSVKSIKRTIDGMAMSKLNVFHWHIIDSNSFPFVVKSHPDFHNLGAYSARKIYTKADIADVIEYARSRGVRVIPEFDAPAHAGEGWQNTKMTVCFNAQPWKDVCFEPPCGQLDPTIDGVYNVLEDIYRELVEAFNPDIFHMGTDTVSFGCWNSSASIRTWMRTKGWGLTESDFVKLFGYFQVNALSRLDKVTNGKKLPIILWATQLTEAPYIDQYLDKSRYIVQSFQAEADWRTQQILDRGMRLISTNLDLFINSGTASWNRGWGGIGGWQKLYENKPDKVFGGINRLILGSEAAVWTEIIDEFSLDTLLWPKASALGERLWSNPLGGWARAESRLVVHRDRLTENGIKAEALQPEWCVQNQDECPIDSYQ